MEPTFSVIIPTHQRRGTIGRAIASVLNQTYEGPIQIIVVDDGSNDGTAEFVDEIYGISVDLKLHGKNYGRVAARNTGLREAKNEWVCWLDSDDEYVSTYFEHFAKAIRENPETKVFTCGALVFNDQNMWFRTREVFVPEKGQQFKSGHIGTGSFVFKREIAPVLPECKNPYGDSDSFAARVQKMLPLMQNMYELYGQNDSNQWLPLGNPWGDDYAAFYALTRENSVVGIPLPLYLQHVRN